MSTLELRMNQLSFGAIAQRSMGTLETGVDFKEQIEVYDGKRNLQQVW
jgi:hypothetical protein